MSMVYDPETAVLRYLRIGYRELVRGIYAAVRDRQWGTAPSRVSGLHLETGSEWFKLGFDVECENREVNFFWKGTIIGDPDGSVTFSMDGLARSVFFHNRTGLCALHPMRECAGRECVIEKVDGVMEKEVFPEHISPLRPLFGDIRSLSYSMGGGISVQLRFEGDTFEMEDQRNWTDASFKTYCTPLALPFPRELEEGTRVAQSVTVEPRVARSTSAHRSTKDEPTERHPEVSFSVDPSASHTDIPRVGLGSAGHGKRLTEDERQRLRAMGLSHLRLDLNPSTTGHEAALRQAADEARDLGAGLEIALFLSESDEAAMSSLMYGLEAVEPDVARWLVFEAEKRHTTRRLLALSRRALSRYDPTASFVTGTDAYFVQFNRNPPPLEGADMACYSINPQVHAGDNCSLAETLEAQAETVNNARRLTGGLPVAVTPVTLKPRYNPIATGPETEPEPGELPPQVDPRQASLFVAGWTLGSVKYLSESGAHSATYYETTGWRGVMETGDGAPLPDKFRSIPGGVFPLYHVLADVGEFSGGTVIPSRSSDPLEVDGLALYKEGRTRILLANLGREHRTVRLLHQRLGGSVRVKRLDESNAEDAIRHPEAFRADPGDTERTAKGEPLLNLSPYSLTRVDFSETADG